MVELINAGADVRRVRRYLEQYAGDLASMFDEKVNQEMDSYST